MANRKRNIQMKFYVTEDEKRLIDEKMSQLPTRRYGAYLRKMAIITRQNDVDKLKEQLESFQVHPQYEDISRDANNLTEQIHICTNTLVLRQQLLERYQTSYSDETPSLPVVDIEKIYAEAGVLFQDSILRPLSEVINFHNRKNGISPLWMLSLS